MAAAWEGGEFVALGPDDAFDAPSVSWDAVALAARLRGMPATFVGIAGASGVAESTLRNWDTDRVTSPSARTIDAVAHALDVPRRFLLRSDPVPRTTRLTFRRKSARELSVERAILDAFVSLTGLFARFLLDEKWGRPQTPDPLAEVEAGSGGQVAAVHLRERLGLSLNVPIVDLVGLAESLGVLVVHGPSMPEGLDACSAVVDSRRVIVVRKNNTDYYRQRWDVAHEIGHFVMGHDSAGRENESAANDFAESLLFPWTMANRRRLVGAIRDSDDIQSLLNVQEDWRISVDALLTAAKKRKIPSAQDKVVLLKESRLHVSVGPPPAESPSILPNAAEEAELLRNRPIEAIAREEGFPSDMVAMMVARTPPL